MNETNTSMNRALGLSSCITITAGAVIGVGLFTTGSSAAASMGSSTIIATIIAFLMVLWPSMIYGELGATLPLAGGTYAFAKRGINYPVAIFCSWHYTVAQIGIAGAEALAFANYFGRLLHFLNINVAVNEKILASVLIIIFVVINYFGIETAGKWQNVFMFFFWGMSTIWFFMVLKNVDMGHFMPVLSGIPHEVTSFAKLIVAIWWCFAGFETVVGMGSEIEFPQITIPRALIISPFIVFGVNALFQWFLIGITPLEAMGAVSEATAPFAEAMEMAGLVGVPAVVLCLGITFGGDFSTMNPCITGPSRYMYTMAADGCFPKVFGKLHPKYKSPYISVLTVGVVALFLIWSGSISIIAAMCAFSQMICYIIGYISYLQMYKKEPDLKRPWKVPAGKIGAVISIIVYLAIMVLAVDWSALPYNIVLSVACIVYYFLAVRNKPISETGIEIEKEALQLTEPTAEEKKRLDRQFRAWKIGAIAVFVLSCGLFVISIAF